MSTVFITGGHAGIGLEAATHLASRSRCDLVLAGRSVERMEPAAQHLPVSFGVKVTTLKLDTSSLESVREAAAEFQTLLDSGKVDPLGALICNAGGRTQRANKLQPRWLRNDLRDQLPWAFPADRVAY